DLVLDVSEVLDERDPKPAGGQVPPHHVEDERAAGVADVAQVVGGDAAHVHPHPAGDGGHELLLPAGERAEDPQPPAGALLAPAPGGVDAGRGSRGAAPGRARPATGCSDLLSFASHLLREKTPGAGPARRRRAQSSASTATTAMAAMPSSRPRSPRRSGLLAL